MLTHSFGQLAYLVQRQISLFRSALCWMALILVSGNAMAFRCPDPSELRLHAENGGVVYTTNSGWQSALVNPSEFDTQVQLRFKFALTKQNLPTDPYPILAYCAYVASNTDADTPRIELSPPKLAEYTSISQAWYPIDSYQADLKLTRCDSACLLWDNTPIRDSKNTKKDVIFSNPLPPAGSSEIKIKPHNNPFWPPQ